MSQIVLYFLLSTSVLSFYMDVVLTLSINAISCRQIPILLCISNNAINTYFWVAAWRQSPETWSLHSQIERIRLECRNEFIGTHFAACINMHILRGVWCLSPMHYFINLAWNILKFVCLKIRLTNVFDFKWRHEQRCRWLLGTYNWHRAHVGDVIIVWRHTRNKTKPNVIWFPVTMVTLTDTDLNI